MADLDLIFENPPPGGPPYDLVFGGEATGESSDRTILLVADLPAVQVTGAARRGQRVSFAAVLPGLSTSGQATYASNTARPLVNESKAQWQEADVLRTLTHEPGWREAKTTPAELTSTFEAGQPMSAQVEGTYTDADRVPRAAGARFQNGQGLGSSATTSGFQDGLRDHRISAGARHQNATSSGGWSRTARHQDGLRDRRNFAAAPWQTGTPYSRESDTSFQKAMRFLHSGAARYQDAWPPRPGRSTDPTTPEVVPPYVPPAGSAVDLLFERPWAADAFRALVFGATGSNPGPGPVETVIVPVQRVYFVLNSTSLKRVADGISIPTFSMSMSLDVDSWTWSFSASVPIMAQADVEPTGDGPVEVEADINGVAYRFLVESLSRERAFGSNSLRLSGRGKSALLDAPYAPTLNFSNTIDRTAQQLMGDVLTLNGVPLDWTVNWAPTDWLVPAGVFSYQGSYIGALNTIVQACGGYLQPANSAQELSVLLRYPTAPWNWASDVTPDYELPSAVTLRESISWADKAEYNRVFVSGSQAGVLGQITRTGTAGDQVAAMVTDALITHSDAARQRGIAVLSDTGRIATVGLSLPVLSSTGVIPPGKFVRYVDGGVTRLGLTRAVSVEVGSSSTSLKQTITMEVHE